jgi:hypothetical protein
MSSPTSPYLFKEASPENINIISNLLKENPSAMFLRKVDRSFPDQAILDLYGNENIELLSLSESKSNNYSHCYVFIICGFFLAGCYMLFWVIM